MKTEAEVLTMLAEIEADDRLRNYEAATIQINAPLALHQTAAEAKARVLREVLGLPQIKYPERRGLKRRSSDRNAGGGQEKSL